jgi:hypothetical protein
MSETEGAGLALDHNDLVSIYVLLSQQEEILDSRQRNLLTRISDHLYRRLSVSQMEEIESYYRTLEGRQ